MGECYISPSSIPSMDLVGILTSRIEQIINNSETPIATTIAHGQGGSCTIPYCDCVIFQLEGYYGFAIRGFTGAITGYGKNGFQLELSGTKVSWYHDIYSDNAVISFYKGF